MKLTLLVLAGLFFHTPAAETDQGPKTLEGVCTAIGAADVDALVAVMGSDLELAILDDEAVYGKTEATGKLRTFFAGLGETSFGKVHQGASKSDAAEYCIGTLTSDKATYRVYVLVGKRGEDIVLQELRFDPN